MTVRSTRLHLFILILLLAAAHSAFAQSIGASLVGVVRDSSGQTISNATITATNIATSARQVQRSNSQGEYTLLDLQPGTYTLHIEAPGFRGYDQKGIILDLNQHATQDVALEVGQVSQTVTVDADVSELDTTSAQISDEVNGAELRNLPLNARNPYQLLTLVPSFAGTTGDDYNSNSFSVNGGRQGYTDVLVDGTPAGFPTVNGNSGIGIFPSIDAIGEFRVLAQNYPAEYGRSLDGIVNVVFKSGTNQFHGTAFEFLRNSFFDANSFFADRGNQPLLPYRRNQFGGELSGPIYKDRTFFLISTELLKQNQVGNAQTVTVPTPLERTGDFSQTFGPDGSLIKIYNPFNTTSYIGSDGQTHYTRQQFDGNVIPQGMLSKVGLAAMAYYPLPTPGLGDPTTHVNNYYESQSTDTQTIAWDVRVDHKISDRQQIFGRYSNRFYESDPSTTWPGQAGIAQGLIDGEDFSRGLTAGYTATINPHLIYDARLGFARTLYNYLNKSLGFQDSTLGLPGSIDTATGTPLFPVLSPAGFVNLGNNGYRHNAFMTYSLLSSVTWVKGQHTFKFGFDGRLIRVNDHESADSAGNFSFGTTWTQQDPNSANAYSGNGLASMLLGTGTGDVIQAYKDDASQSYYLAEYAQDDWRITHKLTLNVGIRYDLDTPRTERFNRTNYFNPTIASPFAQQVPGLTGGLVFVGVNGQSRHQYNIDANNFAPRVGLSYAATSSTVVHAGGAIVYGPSAQAAAGTVGPYGFRVQNTWVSSTNNDGIHPITPNAPPLDDPFPGGFQPPPGAAAGLLTGVGSQIEGAIRNTPTPYVIQYNLDVEQKLPYQTVFDIAYVGNRGRKQQQSREGGIDWDQLPVSALSLGASLQDSVQNPFYPLITTGTLTGPTTTRGQLLKKYSQYTSMLPLFLSGGNNQYDGLQIRVEKRFSAGLQLQGSYVWAKNYDNGTNHQDSFHPMGDYAVSSQDVRQRFVASYIYQLPIGRGRLFGSHMNTAEDLVLGGWQVNGITTLQGGNPLQINASNDLSSFNFQALYANTDGKNATLHGSIYNHLNKYFDTSHFSQPAPFTLGTGPALYDNLRGPGVANTDFSVFKEFNAVERLKVEFRAEAFNIFNRVQFNNPDTGVTDGNFGAISGQANSNRQLQFGLKLLF